MYQLIELGTNLLKLVLICVVLTQVFPGAAHTGNPEKKEIKVIFPVQRGLIIPKFIYKHPFVKIIAVLASVTLLWHLL